jgi:Mitochondrial morphogenesis regulator
MVGNCLHKSALLSSVASLVSGKKLKETQMNLDYIYFSSKGFFWPRNITVSGSFVAVSFFCVSLYTISWNSDPCVNYQIENNPKKLPKFPNLNDFTSPVVLTFKNNARTVTSHRIMLALAMGVVAYRIYKSVK